MQQLFGRGWQVEILGQDGVLVVRQVSQVFRAGDVGQVMVEQGGAPHKRERGVFQVRPNGIATQTLDSVGFGGKSGLVTFWFQILWWPCFHEVSRGQTR